jgi:uncharacterized protein YdaU (DUF1376 family)
MGKMDIWMPVYIGDYLRDTEQLSDKEHGVYLLLLMHYWVKNGAIGSDVERLARVAKTDPVTARFILGSYFTLDGENYKNKRADEEMAKAEKRRDSARQNGLNGGRPPKNNPQETGRLSSGKPKRNPDHNPQKSSSSSSSPSHTHKENIKNNIPAIEKHEYGPEKNVMLTDAQYSKLVADYGEAMAKDCIEELSTAKAMKGYKYKRDDLAIRKWVVRAVTEKKEKGANTNGSRVLPGIVPDEIIIPKFIF